MRPTGKYFLVVDIYRNEIDPSYAKSVDDLDNIVSMMESFKTKVEAFLVDVEENGDTFTFGGFEAIMDSGDDLRVHPGTAKFAGILLGEDKEEYEGELVGSIDDESVLEVLDAMEAYVFKGEKGKYYIEMEQFDFEYWLLVEYERV